MNKEKTIVEWLEELPDGYRELAIKNYDPNYNGGLPVSDLSDAIFDAFPWRDSPEERKFWLTVWWWARDYGELPPLPEEK